MEGFRIENKRGRNGTCRIVLSGRFGDRAALELEECLKELLGGRAGEIRIDCKGVSRLSRTNLGVLFGMVSSFRSEGAELRLRNLPPAAEADIKIVTGENYFNLVRER